MYDTLTIRIDKQTKSALEAFAIATDRSKAYLALNAIKEYLTHNLWQIQAIEEGVKEADSGKLIDHDEVKKWVDSWGNKRELEKPE
ncbi:MAG: CopG family ribbon-helix-helix protein [Gammaproteobacteria bacterium]|nr:CopG family ribbon-helix-helix protein [Gammaproteobacteria bacterium]